MSVANNLASLVEELTQENARLKAEVERLSTPDLFGSLPNLHSDLDDVLTYEPNYEVIRIERYKKLPDIFVVWGPTDEEGHGYEIVEHNTKQEAEAFVKSLKVAG